MTSCTLNYRDRITDVIVSDFSKVEHDSKGIVFEFFEVEHDSDVIVFEFFKVKHDSPHDLIYLK